MLKSWMLDIQHLASSIQHRRPRLNLAPESCYRNRFPQFNPERAAMKLIIHEIQLPLRHTFTITHGSTDVQHNLIVELREGDISGYGEAATVNGYYGVDPDSMKGALEGARSAIENDELDDPAKFWDRIFPKLGDNRFALCALDEAAHDLWGKIRGAPVWKLWGLGIDKIPDSDYTIGIDTIDKMVEKLKEFDGWPIYKIKLGTDHDLDIVRALRKHTDAVFRVDANTAWTADQTIEFSKELKKLNVEFIEQPMAADRWEDHKRVFRESALPIIADESCIIEDDVEKCIGHFHGINIKLTKAGGMTPAKRMIEKARQNNLQVMIGCMTESSVGISAIAQLLPLLDYVDMDGIVLIAKDVATGVKLEKGRPIMPNVNGNGVTWLG
jgi:L-alanine-DL-glutamate epimerase-like enolase superfamily enzyme